MYILGICEILKSHGEISELIKTVISIIKILVPVLLVIMGMLDFAKAASAGKEDDIAKGRSIFVKRCIAGALVFFVIAIVQLAISVVASATASSGNSDAWIWECVQSLIGA